MCVVPRKQAYAFTFIPKWAEHLDEISQALGLEPKKEQSENVLAVCFEEGFKIWRKVCD